MCHHECYLVVESITDADNFKETKPSLLNIQYYVPTIFQRFPSKHLFPLEHMHTDKHISVTIWFTVLNAIGAISNMLVKLKIES